MKDASARVKACAPAGVRVKIISPAGEVEVPVEAEILQTPGLLELLAETIKRDSVSREDIGKALSQMEVAAHRLDAAAQRLEVVQKQLSEDLKVLANAAQRPVRVVHDESGKVIGAQRVDRL